MDIRNGLLVLLLYWGNCTSANCEIVTEVAFGANLKLIRINLSLVGKDPTICTGDLCGGGEIALAQCEVLASRLETRDSINDVLLLGALCVRLLTVLPLGRICVSGTAWLVRLILRLIGKLLSIHITPCSSSEYVAYAYLAVFAFALYYYVCMCTTCIFDPVFTVKVMLCSEKKLNTKVAEARFINRVVRIC